MAKKKEEKLSEWFYRESRDYEKECAAHLRAAAKGFV